MTPSFQMATAFSAICLSAHLTKDSFSLRIFLAYSLSLSTVLLLLSLGTEVVGLLLKLLVALKVNAGCADKVVLVEPEEAVVVAEGRGTLKVLAVVVLVDDEVAGNVSDVKPLNGFAAGAAEVAPVVADVKLKLLLKGFGALTAANPANALLGVGADAPAPEESFRLRGSQSM